MRNNHCAIGFQHSLFVDSSSSVWSCGSNDDGRLGLGDSTQRNLPEKIKTISNIISVSAGFRHSIFLDNNGDVFTCGFNGFGRLGLGNTTNRNIPY